MINNIANIRKEEEEKREDDNGPAIVMYMFTRGLVVPRYLFGFWLVFGRGHLLESGLL